MPSTSHAEIEIIPVHSKKDYKDFIGLPYRLYKDDPHWIAPLYVERAEVLNPKKNPYYEHALVQLFLAKRKGKVVGRISAQIDFEYEKLYKSRLGQFGFFECENNAEISNALFESAENFLKENGAHRIQGPYNFSINEECGLLIDGFQEALMTLMPYNPPYYAELIEKRGYKKVKDLYAWKYLIGEVSKEALEVSEQLKHYPGLQVRSINMNDLENDLQKIIEILNSAWSENWGFVPFTPSEIHKMAKDFKLIAKEDGVIIAEIEGNPIAMCVTLPNLYEAIHDLKGRLFPFGFLKLLWRTKKMHYQSGRLLLLGVKKEFRSSVLGGLSILLYAEIHKRALAGGMKWGELSWTLEDNKSVNTGIEFMGGKRYKTYRLFEKQFSSL